VQSFAYVQTLALLVGTLGLGVIAHELSHMVALRMGGVSCTLEVLPNRGDAGQFSAGIGGPLARVKPTRPPDEISPWYLRGAALMPLCLASPLVLILAGVSPDPFVSGGVGPKLALIVWLGCSIPSPQDFSLVWYPERALAKAAGLQQADGRRSG
jgi:hypothetical protein